MARAIYVAYLTGVAGQSVGLFYIGDGLIAGVDVATMQYNGTYRTNDDGSLDGNVEYVLPPNVSLITGSPPGVAPAKVSLKLILPKGFYDGRTIKIETPLGPVNARFEKLKDIP